jgi:predicted small lipoprotein YifL
MIAFALALSGCGQKGPLYLPDHSKTTVPTSSTTGSAHPGSPTQPDETVPASPDQGPPPPH